MKFGLIADTRWQNPNFLFEFMLALCPSIAAILGHSSARTAKVAKALRLAIPSSILLSANTVQ
jgi:hypothetical protein